jgi:putative acetyltransferase
MMLKMVDGGLENEKVLAMLRFHFDTNVAVTPPGSVHVFDVSRLKQHDVFFWSAWNGETLMGTGALKLIDTTHGEIKSMHTLQTARRSGIGAAMLQHIMQQARSRGVRRLSLETGSFAFFAPARALYARHGFEECGPFADYKLDPNSTFMTRQI